MAKTDFATENIFAVNNTNQNDALTALLSLGFDKSKAEKAINRIITEDQSVEDIIKQALKVL